MLHAFYFIGSDVIAQDEIITTCQHCERSTSHTLFLSQHSKKIIGIPSIPLHKEGKLKCSQCGNSRREYDFSQHEKLMLESFKADKKSPWWMYSGFPTVLFIIGVPVVIGLLMRKPIETNPGLIGNIYCVKDDDTIHVIRCIHETKDTIWFEMEYKSSILEHGRGSSNGISVREWSDTIPVLRRSFRKAVVEGDVYNN